MLLKGARAIGDSVQKDPMGYVDPAFWRTFHGGNCPRLRHSPRYWNKAAQLINLIIYWNPSRLPNQLIFNRNKISYTKPWAGYLCFPLMLSGCQTFEIFECIYKTSNEWNISLYIVSIHQQIYPESTLNCRCNISWHARQLYSQFYKTFR